MNQASTSLRNKMTLAETLELQQLKNALLTAKSRNGKGLSRDRKRILQARIDALLLKYSMR